MVIKTMFRCWATTESCKDRLQQSKCNFVAKNIFKNVADSLTKSMSTEKFSW
jgi:hypothetical protein